MTEGKRSRRFHAAFGAIFFVSGIAALLFETLWFRLASLTFGSSAWGAAIVLASFMAGLAIGNLGAMRLRPGIDPLRVYALLETGVAACGIALAFLLPHMPAFAAPLFRSLLNHQWQLNCARLGIAFGLLVLPATMMGASLPAVVRSLSQTQHTYAPALGLLYGCNLLGSMTGAIAGESVLIGRFGIRGTSLVAAALSLFAGAAALSLSGGEESLEAERAESPYSARTIRLLLAAMLCGFALLALEVFWFRFIHLFVFGSNLTFAVMLSVVLLGLGAGSLAVSMVSSRWSSADAWLPLLAAFAGLAVVVAYGSFHPIAKRGPELLMRRETLAAVIDSLRLMLPASVFSGMLFTLLGKAIQREVRDPLRATSLLTFANTAGAAVGSLAAGFLLIPLAGVELSFFLMAAVYGVVVLLTSRRGMTSIIALILAGAALLLFPFGLMQKRDLPLAMHDFLDGNSKVEVVREGTIEMAAYLRTDFAGEPYVERLFTDGFSMSATTFLCRRYMSMFAYLPLAFRPSAHSALLISYGVGVTAKTLTSAQQLNSIDIADISSNVLDLSRTVWPGPTNPLRDPRVRVHIEDGRFFLLTSDRHFDLITGEPPPPKHAGIVNLYTLEYFRLIHERLTEGGIATYWLPIGQLTSSDARAIVSAFCGAFGDCSLWDGAGNEWILMGSRGGFPAPTEEEFSRQWSDRIAGPALRRIGVESPEQLAATFLAGPDELAAFTRHAAPLTDDRPLRLSPYPSREQANDAEELRRDALQSFRNSTFVRERLPAAVRERALGSFATQAIIDRLLIEPTASPPEPEILDSVLTRTNLQTFPRLLLGSNGWLEDSARLARSRGDESAEVLYVLAIGALCDRDERSAQLLFGEAARKGMAPALQYEILAAFLAGDVAYARQRIAAAHEPPERWESFPGAGPRKAAPPQPASIVR